MTITVFPYTSSYNFTHYSLHDIKLQGFSKLPANKTLPQVSQQPDIVLR
jgi:hypothetical protein